MTSDIKWLMASDLQIPYQDNRALELLFKVIKSWKPQIIDLLGDVDDQSCYSRYSDGKPDEFFQQYKASDNKEEVLKNIFTESSLTKKFYKDIRKSAPKAELFTALGNHDIRVFDYLEKKDPEILDRVTPNSLWGLDDLGYDYIYYDDLPKHRYGDIYVHHGIAVSQNAGESVRKDVDSFGVSIARGHCFSADTEILTRNGWMAYTEINVGDEVYTLNRDTNLGEWQKIEEKFIYDDFTKLVSIKSNNVDLLVTDGHGMVYHTRRSNEWKEIKAGEIENISRAYLPMSAMSSDPEVDFTDAEIKMLAWIVAEANFDEYTTESGEIRKRVRLSQSDAPDGRLQRLEKLFEELDWKWSPILRYAANTRVHGTWRNYDAYRITCRREDSNELISRGLTSDKLLKGDMINMSARQAEVYLKEYIWADGNKNSSANNSWQISSSNYENISMLQALAVKAGYRTSVINRPSGVFALTINSRGEAVIEPRHISRQEYNGEVWCVTVPNHTLMVRRNGKAVVTMNSHRMGTYYKTYELRDEVVRGYEIGHLCDPTSFGMKYTTIHNWQQGFAIAHIVDGQPHVQLIEIKDYTCVVDGKVFQS